MEEKIRRILAGRKRCCLTAPSDHTPAAVLVPLLRNDGRLHLLFTRRTELVATHKGQISFPGGMAEAEDKDLLETALRESCEEIGLVPADVNVLGAHDDIKTMTKFVITPFIGSIPFPYPFRPNPDEIAELFFLPVEELLSPEAARVELFPVQDGERYKVYYFHCRHYVIWGATAKICAGLLRDVFDWREPPGQLV